MFSIMFESDGCVVAFVVVVSGILVLVLLLPH